MEKLKILGYTNPLEYKAVPLITIASNHDEIYAIFPDTSKKLLNIKNVNKIKTLIRETKEKFIEDGQYSYLDFNKNIITGFPKDVLQIIKVDLNTLKNIDKEHYNQLKQIYDEDNVFSVRIFPKTIQFKTIQLLLTLNLKESQKFKEYLASPYFNKIVSLPQLYNNIIHLYHEKKGVYDETELIKITYRGDFNLRKYESDFKKLKEHFENFTAIEILETHVLKKAIATLEDHLYRNNGAFFELKYKQAKKLFDAHPKDVNYFQYLYEMESLKDTYILLYKDKRTGDTNMQLVSDAIDKDLLTKKLCYFVLMHNRQNITRKKYNFGFKEYVLDYLNKKETDNEPIINLFYWAYQILEKTNGKEAFEQLYQQLLKKDFNISRDVINVLYLIMHNNLKFVFENKIEQNIQYFRLYDMLLRQKYIQVNGKISIQFFKSVFTVCLELGKYHYLEEFLKQYENKLYPEEFAKDTVGFYKAKLYPEEFTKDTVGFYKAKLYPEEFAKDIVGFYKAKLFLYKGELSQLTDIDFNKHFKDSSLKLDMKCLEIMLNYELQQFQVLDSLIPSFQVALTPQRSKMLQSKSRVQENRNFINYFNKLYRLSTSPNTTNKDVKQLLEIIENADNTADQKWLMKKATALL